MVVDTSTTKKGTVYTSADYEKILLTFDGVEYSRRELSEAFDKVKNPGHWKDPIRSVVAAGDLGVVGAAIRFFTATEPTFTRDEDGRLIVEADGYRAGPAGDH